MSDCFDHEADAWDDLERRGFDDFDDQGGYGIPVLASGSKPITCNRCGQKGLRWYKTPQGWRTANATTLHVCDPIKVKGLK